MSLDESQGIADQAADIDISTIDDIFTEPSVIYVGVTGAVKVALSKNGDVVTFANVPAGLFLPVTVLKVFKTGTTAASLVRIF